MSGSMANNIGAVPRLCLILCHRENNKKAPRLGDA
jgi:hypothetical protein